MENQERRELSYELMKYENQWVAILEPEERIVGTGADAYEAQQDAERNGYSDEVFLLRVRSAGSYHAFTLGNAI